MSPKEQKNTNGKNAAQVQAAPRPKSAPSSAAQKSAVKTAPKTSDLKKSAKKTEPQKKGKPIKIKKEFKNLIRPLHRQEFLQLEENILRDGCLNPIITWNGFIVDGHNRYEICTKHNVEFNVVEMDFMNIHNPP